MTGPVDNCESVHQNSAPTGNITTPSSLPAPRSSDHTELPLLIVFMLAWYGFWLWLSAGPPSHRPTLYLTFNSMLEHLLHGRFDVDPQIVGFEGYLRDGHVYAYWGIWCALLRLPLWIVGRLNLDITIWSCLAAVCIAATAKLKTVFLLRRFDPHTPNTRLAVDLMLVYILMGGSEMAYLKATIYQEVILWAAAFGAIFVYFAMKGLVTRNFSLATLSFMALSAGLALLTRVSNGIGLIGAFAFLLLVLMAQSASNAPHRLPLFRRSAHALLHRRILIPIAILSLCVLATATVNYFRWGNPATFVNFNLYIGNNTWIDRVTRESAFGLFSLDRIPFGLMYYFFPVWTQHTASGHFFFERMRLHLFDGVELPASSFLLTDLLPLCFVALLSIGFLRRRTLSPPHIARAAAIAAGLFVPCLLMLTAIYEAYRYRMEFYPEIEFLAFLGLYLVLTREEVQTIFTRIRIWMVAALAISAAGSLAMLIIYQHSYFGPARLIPH